MYQIVIVNLQGATLRTGPATGGGEIRKVTLGEAFQVDGLVFSVPQQEFELNSIPAFIEAFKRNRVRGDVWARLAEKQLYRNEPTIAYVAFKVSGTQFGSLVLSPDSPGTNGMDEISIRQSEIDEMFRCLSARRLDLENRRAR